VVWEKEGSSGDMYLIHNYVRVPGNAEMIMKTIAEALINYEK